MDKTSCTAACLEQGTCLDVPIWRFDLKWGWLQCHLPPKINIFWSGKQQFWGVQNLVSSTTEFIPCSTAMIWIFGSMHHLWTQVMKYFSSETYLRNRRLALAPEGQTRWFLTGVWLSARSLGVVEMPQCDSMSMEWPVIWYELHTWYKNINHVLQHIVDDFMVL